METVNNLVSTASNLIWGEGNGANGKKENETMGQEPLSGETGNVEKGEPYDKGNAEPTSTPAGLEEPKSASQTEQDLKTTYNTEDLKTTYNTEEPKSASETPEQDLMTTYNTEEPKTTGETEPTSTPPKSEEPKSTIETEPNPKTTAPMTTSNTTDQKPTSSEETTADPSSAPQNTQKQQGADRPFDEPSSEEHDRIKETKKEAEDAAKVDTSGPGPKSLEEKASETGGMLDAGAGGATAGKVESGSKGVGDNDDGPQKESHGEGTGEKYVKSSGMGADGGDFDAAKPGAAREADRLLEEKGVHHEVGATSSPAGKEDVGADAKADKPKLSERIKAKLHIHGKDKD